MTEKLNVSLSLLGNRSTAMLGDRTLTPIGESDWDRRQRLTSPGMADWCDLDSNKHCRSCRHFRKGRCQLFLDTMRARLRRRDFQGPKLPIGQRACRKYEASNDEPTRFSRSSTTGGASMASISQRYGKRGLLTVEKFRQLFPAGEHVFEIEEVLLDHDVGDKKRDVVQFTDGCQLALNTVNALAIATLHGDDSDEWPGGKIALYVDDNVEMGNGKITSGLRVRNKVPEGNEPTQKVPRAKALDEEIPY